MPNLLAREPTIYAQNIDTHTHHAALKSEVTRRRATYGIRSFGLVQIKAKQPFARVPGYQRGVYQWVRWRGQVESDGR